MEKVLGFGGFFFRADDSSGLAQWYLEVLGINLVPQSADGVPWVQEAGPTIFSPFAKDTDYFAADKQFMLNFRVRDLAAMVAQLEGRGIVVTVGDAIPGIGNFARLADPEGTPIELWESEA